MRPTFKWNLIFLWHTFFPSNIKKYLAWKTWKKYENLFITDKIFIWSEQSPWIENGELIVVANKKQVERIIRENEQDFRPFKQLKIKDLFKESLQFHDGRLGTLLGYGRLNSWLFYENKRDSLKPIFSSEHEQLFKNTKAALYFSFGWPAVEMTQALVYPTILGDPNDAETKKLQLDYLQTRKQILDFYQDKDFLEATLQLLQRS
jgi:hypothetical protein